MGENVDTNFDYNAPKFFIDFNKLEDQEEDHEQLEEYFSELKRFISGSKSYSVGLPVPGLPPGGDHSRQLFSHDTDFQFFNVLY